MLQLLSEGMTTKQIAIQLYISPKTRRSAPAAHDEQVEIDNVAQLTKYAIREGLTSAEL